MVINREGQFASFKLCWVFEQVIGAFLMLILEYAFSSCAMSWWWLLVLFSFFLSSLVYNKLFFESQKNSENADPYVNGMLIAFIRPPIIPMAIKSNEKFFLIIIAREEKERKIVDEIRKRIPKKGETKIPSQLYICWPQAIKWLSYLTEKSQSDGEEKTFFAPDEFDFDRKNQHLFEASYAVSIMSTKGATFCPNRKFFDKLFSHR